MEFEPDGRIKKVDPLAPAFIEDPDSDGGAAVTALAPAVRVAPGS